MTLRAALLAFAATLPATATECPEMRRVALHLAVNATVDTAALDAAREEAGWILRSLCADIEWRDREQADVLLIRILSAPVSAGSTPDALGLAMPNIAPGTRGAVFLGRIRERVEGSGKTVSVPILLGSVIAHEVGHLLLGSTTHSPVGIMTADFGKREMAKAAQRQLVFTAAERNLFIRQPPRTTTPRLASTGAVVLACTGERFQIR